MALTIKNIYPLIVRSNYYRAGTWELPHYKFPNKSFILTWVILDTPGAMLYLTANDENYLNNNILNWQQKTFENLRRSITEEENIYTHTKISDYENKIICLGFLHSDGIGSSRILLSYELTKAFPHGYYIALPDRSFGIVIGKDIKSEELSDMKKTIKFSFNNATTSMSDQLYLPNEFELPEDWTNPINVNLSDVLINEIVKLRAN